MDTLNVMVLLGTGRRGARSARVASWVMSELVKRDDITSELFEAVKDISYTVTTPPWGEGGANDVPTPWKEAISRTDALLIISPEYNHGYPGELKLLLDSLYKEYVKIPCGIVSVSDGAISGARMTEQLRLVVNELGMIPMKKVLHVAKVKEAFDEKGLPTDPTYESRLAALVDDLVLFSKALKVVSRE